MKPAPPSPALASSSSLPVGASAGEVVLCAPAIRVHAFGAIERQVREARRYAGILALAADEGDREAALAALRRVFAALQCAEAVGAMLARVSPPDEPAAIALIQPAFAGYASAMLAAHAYFGDDLAKALQDVAATAWP